MTVEEILAEAERIDVTVIEFTTADELLRDAMQEPEGLCGVGGCTFTEHYDNAHSWVAGIALLNKGTE